MGPFRLGRPIDTAAARAVKPGMTRPPGAVAGIAAAQGSQGAGRPSAISDDAQRDELPATIDGVGRYSRHAEGVKIYIDENSINKRVIINL